MSKTLKSMVEIAIIKALKKNKGNVVNAAKTLGISRTGIYYKMKQLDIEPKDYRKAC